MSFAIPVWDLDAMYEKAGGDNAKGKPLEQVFIAGDIGKLVEKSALTNRGAEQVCMSNANEALVLPIAAVDEGQDILVLVVPEKKESTLAFAILQDEEPIYTAKFQNDVNFVFTFSRPGNYRAVVLNPTFATQCAQVAALNVEWEKMLE